MLIHTQTFWKHVRCASPKNMFGHECYHGWVREWCMYLCIMYILCIMKITCDTWWELFRLLYTVYEFIHTSSHMPCVFTHQGRSSDDMTTLRNMINILQAENWINFRIFNIFLNSIGQAARIHTNNMHIRTHIHVRMRIYTYIQTCIHTHTHIHCIQMCRFVYIGPQNTFTPLHRDTLCSYSWSANVMGVKKWCEDVCVEHVRVCAFAYIYAQSSCIHGCVCVHVDVVTKKQHAPWCMNHGV